MNSTHSMTHEIELDIPDILEDRDEIMFLPNSMPEDLFNTLERFTRIPNGEWILRFVCAYELIPLWRNHAKSLLNSCPIMFLTGPSGSGKSTLPNILQRLNPRADGSIAGISAGSNYKGWEQSLNSFRFYTTGKKKPFPLMSIDDLTPDCFQGIVGDLRLNFFKQVVVHTGSFTIGGVDGTPRTTDAYCKLLCSSISDLPTYDGLGELERRILRIRTKKTDDWTDDDHWGITRDSILEEHTEYVFSSTYDEARHMWFNRIASDYVASLKKLKAMLKGDFKGFLPQNRVEIFSPIIALTSVAFDCPLEASLDAFKSNFLDARTEQAESALTKLLKGFLDSPNNVFKKRELAYTKYGQGYEVTLKELAVFLNVKVQEKELTKNQATRDATVNVMSSLGFAVSVEDSCTVFKKESREMDDE